MISSAMSEVGGTLSRASQGIKIAVDQDNILQAARIIEAEAVHLRRKVEARWDALQVHSMGGDPVSGEAAEVLTGKLRDEENSYYNRCLQYAAMLESLATQLVAAAQTYGYTEAETAALFNGAKLEGEARPLDLTGPRHGGRRAD